MGSRVCRDSSIFYMVEVEDREEWEDVGEAILFIM